MIKERSGQAAGKALRASVARSSRARLARLRELPGRVERAVDLGHDRDRGALDRIVIAAAKELSHLRVSANCVNPGPTDNGWMSQRQQAELTALTPLGRLGRPHDAANMIAFLCSAEGGWVNGQLLHSNGGF